MIPQNLHGAEFLLADIALKASEFVRNVGYDMLFQTPLILESFPTIITLGAGSIAIQMNSLSMPIQNVLREIFPTEFAAFVLDAIFYFRIDVGDHFELIIGHCIWMKLLFMSQQQGLICIRLLAVGTLKCIQRVLISHVSTQINFS